MLAPCTCATGTRHEFTASPSTSTVHAPHSPSPQPSFVPVSPHSSRSTSRRRVSGCAFTATVLRLIFKRIVVSGSAGPPDRRLHDLFRRRRNLRDGHSCVPERIDDRGRRSIDGHFTDTLRTERAVLV